MLHFAPKKPTKQPTNQPTPKKTQKTQTHQPLKVLGMWVIELVTCTTSV